MYCLISRKLMNNTNKPGSMYRQPGVMYRKHRRQAGIPDGDFILETKQRNIWPEQGI